MKKLTEYSLNERMEIANAMLDYFPSIQDKLDKMHCVNFGWLSAQFVHYTDLLINKDSLTYGQREILNHIEHLFSSFEMDIIKGTIEVYEKNKSSPRKSIAKYLASRNIIK